jgi:hypothetical protein
VINKSKVQSAAYIGLGVGIMFGAQLVNFFGDTGDALAPVFTIVLVIGGFILGKKSKIT